MLLINLKKRTEDCCKKQNYFQKFIFPVKGYVVSQK